MEFFNKTRAVKLRSIHNKYLVADDDNKTVRQSRNGLTRKARWIVEPIDHSPQAIRLKSFHGGYLTASSSHFLLGFTGDKVLLTRPEHPRDLSVEWAPVRDGFQVRLVTAFGGTCLRANGGMPPWKNSVTHDGRSVKRSWILWEVEEVEIPENEESTDYFSDIGSEVGSEIGSPRVSIYTNTSPMESIKENNAIYCYKSPHIVVSSNNKIPSGIELFRDAKAVRLRSHHDKYLAADGDEISVTQDRNGSSYNTHWTVEFLSDSENRIRLKSCYGKYLTASNKLFLFGMAGRKVLQTADRLASSVEWEPILDGHHVILKTRNGKFLRANGGVPPWRNSVTHDVPNRTATQDWILWDVDSVETALSQPKPGVLLELEGYPESLESGSSLESNQWDKLPSLVREESNDSKGSSGCKSADGRVISYSVADEYGNVDEGLEERCFMFKGNGIYELTRRLEEETGLEEIIVCSRSPLDGKLKPLRLHLPPQNVDMHIVVVPSSSRAARDFTRTGTQLRNFPHYSFGYETLLLMQLLTQGNQLQQ
ncbi:hypothetical protein Vadar_023584 [Vaccinium darrowii]|uniref:Uncharacterized protein n=1 Tax=Vaccinium darrowii TaxID=229202 RepID=A0ACB7X384_9ERIC|nr:hypothetical protein Vadar_023584 [Vaccinium darrowii]